MLIHQHFQLAISTVIQLFQELAMHHAGLYLKKIGDYFRTTAKASMMSLAMRLYSDFSFAATSPARPWM